VVIKKLSRSAYICISELFAVQSLAMPFFPAMGNISANLFLTLVGVFMGRSVIKALSNREE
jgi:CrcB protein